MKEFLDGLLTAVRSPRAASQLPVMRQFVKFSLVGTINTLVSTAVYTLATRPFGLDPLIGNALAFVVAVTVSFFLNKFWTFGNWERRYARQYSRFFTISGVGFLTSELVIILLHKIGGLHDFIAFFFAIAIGLLWNFNANRSWTFPWRT